MKIGLFSDPHYCQADDIGLNRRPILSLNKLKEAMDEFKKNDVDVCFCLGDLIDHAQNDTKEDVLNNLKEVLSIINSYNLPFYYVPGNHDFVDLSRQELKESGLPIFFEPKLVEFDNYNFVLLDANFRSSGEHFDTEGVVWDDANIPKKDLFILQKLLSKNKKSIVMVHENLDPTVQEQHIIKNAEDVRKIIKESGHVSMVIQGHYHYGSEWQDNDIPYHTVKAMCIGTDNSYEIIEI